MAKLEGKLAKAIGTKQAKAKKRKHTETENDEEVASKSLIVEVAEAPQSEPKAESTSAKATKRKHNKSKSKIKEKRSKVSDGEELEELVGGDDNENADAANVLHEPTLDELRESEKPENIKAVLTVRQKKKQKHLKRVDTQKDQSMGKEKQRNKEYLQKWKTARAEWKFEKLRQISIQHSVFEEKKIGADIWPIALGYLSGTKGAAKDKITKLAEDLIDQLDKQCELKTDEQDRQAIVDSTKYQRARNLLQSFD